MVRERLKTLGSIPPNFTDRVLNPARWARVGGLSLLPPTLVSNIVSGKAGVHPRRVNPSPSVAPQGC